MALLKLKSSGEFGADKLSSMRSTYELLPSTSLISLSLSLLSEMTMVSFSLSLSL